MSKEDCFELGYVIKSHGVRGEVGIMLDVDIPEEYEELESVLIETKNELVPHFIEEISIRGNKAIVKFEEFEKIEDVQPILGCKLFLPLDVLPQLKDDQFYYHEIVDFQIIDKQLGSLGKVDNVYTMPTHDMISMMYQEKEVLIPILPEIVLSADKEEKIIHVDLPNGLLEVYLEE